MTSNSNKIYVAGHRGMVGSAIIRQLQSAPCRRSAPAAMFLTRTHADLDLTNQAAVQAFFAKENSTQVYLAAAKVGVIEFDTGNPDGSPRKLMDSSRLNSLGWQAQVVPKAGLATAMKTAPSQNFHVNALPFMATCIPPVLW